MHHTRTTQNTRKNRRTQRSDTRTYTQTLRCVIDAWPMSASVRAHGQESLEVRHAIMPMHPEDNLMFSRGMSCLGLDIHSSLETKYLVISRRRD